jgi:hypothetical protein
LLPKGKEEGGEEEGEEVKPKKGTYGKIHLVLGVPSGKLSDIVRTVNFLKRLFERLDVRVEISAGKGKISTTEYEDKVKEAISQTEIEVEKEELE